MLTKCNIGRQPHFIIATLVSESRSVVFGGFYYHYYYYYQWLTRVLFLVYLGTENESGTCISWAPTQYYV